MKPFPEQIHKYSVDSAHMVYSKFSSESLFLRSCEKDYDRARVEANKLRLDFANYGTTCDKLLTCVPTYEKKKINCYPVCTPVDDDEPEVDTDKVCHQLFIQSTPALIWTIDVELDFMPNVTTVALIDGAEVEIKGAITYDAANKKIIVEFSHAVAGKAYLS